MSYDGIAFCAHADTQLGNLSHKWPHKAITWGIAEYLPAVSREAYERCLSDCFANWAKVCGIRPRKCESGERPNIVFVLQTEGPGGVLADCELPIGATPQTQLRCRVDQADRWCIASGPLSPSHPMLDLGRTITHEIGHGLGLSHLSPGCLMAPTYSVRIWLPQAGDVVEAQARYGEPATEQPTEPTAMPDDWQQVAAILRRGDTLRIRAIGGREFDL